MARPRKDRDDDILIAVETGVVNVDGEELLVRRGWTRAHRGSRIVRLYPTFFKPIDVHFKVEKPVASPK